MPAVLQNMQELVMSPTGVNITLTTPFSSFEGVGVTVVVVAAAISLVCAVVLLTILGASMWRKRSAPSEHFFVRTHAAAYFISLLVADLIQAIGSLMSSRWVTDGGVTLDSFCNVQGAIKNAGNLAISFWTLMLAVHTFCILFLRWKPKDWVLYATLIGIWLLVGFLVVIGPAAVEKPDKGPYFGISGYWCWIADPYPAERVALEYAWMFISAGLSFVLYALTFLRLRGNISIVDGKPQFRMIDSASAWRYQISRDSSDIQMTSVARGMLGFPILFTVLVLPIAICRFVAWSGKSVPFEATIFADAVFSLTGVFDLILFTTTRSLFPSRGILSGWFSPRPRVSPEVMEHGFQPYNVQDFTSAHGFNEMYQSQAERNMASLPQRTSASLNRVDTPALPTSLPTGPMSLDELPIPPPIPDDETRSPNPNRLTTKTFGSRSSMSEYTEYAAWDDVDLERSHSERSLGAPTHALGRSDTQYTTFSLSAYEYGGEPSVVPDLPSRGAGIDVNAGHDFSDEEDDRNLVRPSNSSAGRSRFSDASEYASEYDLRSPEEAHTPRRF